MYKTLSMDNSKAEKPALSERWSEARRNQLRRSIGNCHALAIAQRIGAVFSELARGRGFDMGSMTASDRSLQRQMEPFDVSSVNHGIDERREDYALVQRESLDQAPCLYYRWL